MSDYRSNVLPANIESAKSYMQDLCKLKHWLDRGVFELTKYKCTDCDEQNFAEAILELTRLRRCGFLDDPNPELKEQFELFYKQHFGYGLSKQQEMLVFAFLEDMFDGVKIKEMIGVYELSYEQRRHIERASLEVPIPKCVLDFADKYIKNREKKEKK